LKKHGISSFEKYQSSKNLISQLRKETCLEVDFLTGKGFASEITLSTPLAQIHPYFGYCEVNSPSISCDLSEVLLGSVVKHEYALHHFLWITSQQLAHFPVVRYRPKHLHVKFAQLFQWYEMIGE
jgi:hypothetical protein